MLCHRWSDPYPNGCANPAAALFFFDSFIILVSYAMLNLFVAVVIEQFGEVCGAVSATGKSCVLFPIWQSFGLTCAVLSCPILSCPVLSCPVLWAVLCCAVLCCAVLCCAVLQEDARLSSGDLEVFSATWYEFRSCSVHLWLKQAVDIPSVIASSFALAG